MAINRIHLKDSDLEFGFSHYYFFPGLDLIIAMAFKPWIPESQIVAINSIHLKDSDL